MPDAPNVAIILTPTGGAAIAVVRARGAGVPAILRDHFSKPVADGRCVHGALRDAAGHVLDDPVVVTSAGGTIADVNLHGGPWVVRSVLELLRRAGFDVVEPSPGPVPLDAVDGETAVEREVLAHLPLARTELGVRALLAQVDAWAALAGSPDPEVARSMLADRGLWWLLHPPRVAVVGAPNVGKSTLANQLFAQERSITADLPGTTRDWVGELADVNGLPVMLVDTPGLRETPDHIERAAIARGREQVAAADLVVVVLDGSRAVTPDEAALLGAHPDALVVLNKADRAAAAAAAGAVPARVPHVRTVATAGAGVDGLRARIAGRFACEGLDVTRARWWTERQRELLERIARAGGGR